LEEEGRALREGGAQDSSARPDASGLSLRDFVEAFYTHKKVFLISLVVTPLIALVVSFLIPKVYQASTKIWAKEQRTGDPFRIEESRLSFLKDQQELILSNVVASKVLDSFSEIGGARFFKKPWKTMSPGEQAETIARLRKNVEAEVDPGSVEGGSSFILVKVKASSAMDAAALANLFAEKYIEYYFELKSKSARDSYKFLETQKDQVAANLAESEAALQSFERKLGPKLVPLIELSKFSASASVAEAYKFIGAYDLFASDWAEKSKGFERLQQLQKETGGNFIPSDAASKNLSLIHLRDSLISLKLKLEQLKQRWLDKSKEIEQLQKEVSYAEDLLRKQIWEDMESRGIEFSGARHKLDFMEKRARELQNDLAEIAENRVTYEKLRREVENQSAIYKKVQEELENARIAAEMSVHKTANIYVIDRAAPPLRPIRPNKVLNMALGFLGGLIIGLGLVMIAAYTDQTVRRPDHISRYLGLDVLGSVSSYGVSSPAEPTASLREEATAYFQKVSKSVIAFFTRKPKS